LFILPRRQVFGQWEGVIRILVERFIRPGRLFLRDRLFVCGKASITKRRAVARLKYRQSLLALPQ
jgi:hypothetical protein